MVGLAAADGAVAAVDGGAGCTGAGGFGRKASATLRSLYPFVLGLGGWFVGVLLVVTTMPGVPLDDELLADALDRRCRSGSASTSPGCTASGRPATKATGFAAAVAGALAGAWLGFHAAADLLALVTAIAGAAAGANLRCSSRSTSSAPAASASAAVVAAAVVTGAAIASIATLSKSGAQG